MKKIGWVIALIILSLVAAYGVRKFLAGFSISIRERDISGIIFFIGIVLYFVINLIVKTKRDLKKLKTEENTEKKEE